MQFELEAFAGTLQGTLGFFEIISADRLRAGDGSIIFRPPDLYSTGFGGGV